MKKYTLALVLFAVLPIVSADAAYQYESRNGSYYSARPVKTSTYKKSARRSGGYTNTITNNFYYTGQPVQRSAYSAYNYDDGYVAAPAKKTTKKTSYSSQMRKYFLAHPFFQPLQGKFGSVTDVSYTQNRFNFDIIDGSTLNIDKASTTYRQATPKGAVGISGKQETSQFLVKEDFSYGISDTLAIIGMAQYDKTKVQLNDWSGGEPGDSSSSSGLNIFGIGLQNRFVDNDKWIASIAGFFQHQKDTANTFIGEIKAGYKIDRTTLYGLGRFGYSDLIEGDTYGALVDADDGDWLMLSYNTNIKDVVYVEGGVGAFAVLNKYFTLNGELVYGHYDWHSQLNIKGAIGWQPGDMFALNLYASTSLYDSAKGKTKTYMNYDVNPNGYPVVDGSPVFTDSKLLYTTGDYKIKDYNEWKIGIQAIFYF